VGAKVKYRPLTGCEARIIGSGANAIITVNDTSISRRQRFSIAHELGHWHHHKGKRLMCRAFEIAGKGVSGVNPERVADRYAADLLLPDYIFKPIARSYSKLSFRVVKELADIFDVSMTATAIRLVNSNYFPALLICHGKGGRKWFTRSMDVSEKWFPQAELSAESFAFGLLFGNGSDDFMPRKIGADAWFDRNEANYYELREQSIRISSEEIITLLLIDEEKMLSD
jgi:hypothetical protein